MICCACCAFAGIALADDAQRFVFKSPTVITQPGHYLVTRALQGPWPIQILSDGVILDLGGHRVAGVGGGAINLGTQAIHVEIRNGKITSDTGPGIQYTSTAAALHVTLRDLEIVDTADDALYFRNLARLEIRDCLIQGSGERALEAWSNATYTAEITGNTILDSNSDALFFYNLAGGLVADNTISGFNLSGATGNHSGLQVNCFGCAADQPGLIVRGNTIQGGQGTATGLWATSLAMAYLVQDNVFASNGGDGIQINGNGWRLSGNVIQANGDDGLVVGGNRHLMEGNQIEGNVASGIEFLNANEHVYRNNMIRGNGSAVAGPANTDAGGNVLP
jgi:hypothetical protein